MVVCYLGTPRFSRGTYLQGYSTNTFRKIAIRLQKFISEM